jgi:nucleotide-binding universal stress UspA family protein
MHYLVATASVHTTAAACDYLENRLDGPAADTVTVLTVTAPDVLVLGPRSGAPGATADLGSTARSVLARSPVPAVVVPLDALESDPA